MRQIREHPPFDTKGQIEENERVKESKTYLKNNKGQQSSRLKLELCVGPFVVVT